MDLLGLVTFFIFIVLFSVILYSTIFGYASYNNYTYGYALQNWCNEDYIEYETIRYHYLGMFPNILKPVFMVDFIAFIILTFLFFTKFVYKEWINVNENGDPGRFMVYLNESYFRMLPILLSFIILLFEIIVLISKTAGDDKVELFVGKIFSYMPDFGFDVLYKFGLYSFIIVYVMFFGYTLMYGLNNDGGAKKQFDIANLISYLTYIFMMIYLLDKYSKSTADDLSNVFNMRETLMVLSIMIIPLLLQLLYQYDDYKSGESLFDFVAILRNRDFFVSLGAIYIGVILYDKFMIESRKRVYKSSLIKLNLTISKILELDANSNIAINKTLNKTDIINIYSRDNVFFIQLFAFEAGTEVKKYMNLINPNMDMVRNNMMFYLMELYEKRLIEYIVGDQQTAGSAIDINKRFIDSLMSYEAKHRNEADNKITTFRNEFNDYIENPEKINPLLETNYSIIRENNQMVNMVIQNYNMLNPEIKQYDDRLKFIQVSPIDKFYLVGPIDIDKDILSRSNKLEIMNKNSNETISQLGNQFASDEEMINELYKVIDIANMPSSYFSYYDGDFKKFVARLKELNINTFMITDSLLTQLKADFLEINKLGKVDNDWVMTSVAFSVIALTIYTTLIRAHGVINLSAVTMTIFLVIVVIVIIYSIKLIINNHE